MAKINLLLFWDRSAFIDDFICMSNTTVQNMGFVKGECSRKSKKGLMSNLRYLVS